LHVSTDPQLDVHVDAVQTPAEHVPLSHSVPEVHPHVPPGWSQTSEPPHARLPLQLGIVQAPPPQVSAYVLPPYVTEQVPPPQVAP
jgi:hypothetical protein